MISDNLQEAINEQIKYRERWRPFCPSMLDRVASDILQTDHPSPYMTFTFDVAESWKPRIPEVVHEDGTARAQIVTRDTNQRYYALIEELEKQRQQSQASASNSGSAQPMEESQNAGGMGQGDVFQEEYRY